MVETGEPQRECEVGCERRHLYYARSGLLPYLETLGFHLLGFGCTTCIGNSGLIDPALSALAKDLALVCCRQPELRGAHQP